MRFLQKAPGAGGKGFKIRVCDQSSDSYRAPITCTCSTVCYVPQDGFYLNMKSFK